MLEELWDTYGGMLEELWEELWDTCGGILEELWDTGGGMLEELWDTTMMGFPIYRAFWPYMERIIDKIRERPVSIQYEEYTGEGLQRSQDYDSIRHYLSSISIARARSWEANDCSKTGSMVLCMDGDEEVEDLFEGVEVKWALSVEQSDSQTNARERRYFALTFSKRHREMIVERYLDLVLRKGKEIGLMNRKKKLYTNNSREDWPCYKEANWGNVPFDHPATFGTLAMDPVKKDEIKKDLISFSKGKDYCRKVGKPWTRGYLLFGPPGTGKSTMISAMANFLQYDVYDLDLTMVKDNSELKKLLLDTTGKSIIVIEDIDCSLAFTRQGDNEAEKEKNEDEQHSQVTLSGLLNVIDGLRSASSDEKIIVFTTNFVDKLDPALIRPGIMDSHIEMSFCRFKAFKVLAKNYLGIEAHDMFGEIERLLEETDLSPADVAEDLMPKSVQENADVRLKRLAMSLAKEKEKSRKLK